MGIKNDNQLSLFDNEEDALKTISSKIRVVNAQFKDCEEVTWQDLFVGFDELRAITFSSGISFVNKVLDLYEDTEIIFGNENVMSTTMSAIMAYQVAQIQDLVKNKTADKLIDKIDGGKLKLYVSKDTKSHEKIFILKNTDSGNTRVITGSANMSANAFCGVQRENICVFDNDYAAYEHFIGVFEDYKEYCSDDISKEVLVKTAKDVNYLEENAREIPVLKSVNKSDSEMLVLTDEDDAEPIITTNVHDLDKKFKNIVPKEKETKRIVLSSKQVREIDRLNKNENKKIKDDHKQFPKLHINFDDKTLDLNGKSMNLTPPKEEIKHDVDLIVNLFKGYELFYGDIVYTQSMYYRVMGWFYATVFMPYLRTVIEKYQPGNSIYYPMFCILYGSTSAGKTSLFNILSKSMSGMEMKISTNDFTTTTVSSLRRQCEGLPIIVDDLSKTKFSNHAPDIIKVDNFGEAENLINYPAVAISSNSIPAVKPDISKRAFICKVSSRIAMDKTFEQGESISNVAAKEIDTALFREYVRRMLPIIDDVIIKLGEGTYDKTFDVFEASSNVLYEIFNENIEDLKIYPFIHKFSYLDCFGELARAKSAIEQIKTAYQSDPSYFEINKKKNELTYRYPEGGRTYELQYLEQELPPELDVKLLPNSITMKLDKAEEVFKIKFKKKWKFF